MKSLMRSCMAGVVALWVGCIALPEGAYADDSLPPRAFRPGEKLVYELKWTVIPAGTGTLEVLPMESIRERPAYHFRLTARTNDFLDTFYMVRDTIDGYTDEDVAKSVWYCKRQREGSHLRDEQISFDWEGGFATYRNFGKSKPPIGILPGAFDPMSVLYYVRLQELKTGAVLERPVTDGKKCIIGKARVIGRETIEVPAGIFDTWLIEPELEHIGGVFRKSPGARLQIWLTADDRKRIVRLRSKVIVGSFVADLISIQDPLPTGRRPDRAPVQTAAGKQRVPAEAPVRP